MSVKSFIDCFGNILPRNVPDRALKSTDCLLLTVTKMETTGIFSHWIWRQMHLIFNSVLCQIFGCPPVVVKHQREHVICMRESMPSCDSCSRLCDQSSYKLTRAVTFPLLISNLWQSILLLWLSSMHQENLVKFGKTFGCVRHKINLVRIRKWLVKMLGFKGDLNSDLLGESHLCDPPLKPQPSALLAVFAFWKYIVTCHLFPGTV